MDTTSKSDFLFSFANKSNYITKQIKLFSNKRQFGLSQEQFKNKFTFYLLAILVPFLNVQDKIMLKSNAIKSKDGSIVGTLACGSGDPSSNPAWGKIA